MFYNQVCEARNQFLFSGLTEAIPGEMPGQCLDQVASLLTLFVALHNEYVGRLVF